MEEHLVKIDQAAYAHFPLISTLFKDKLSTSNQSFRFFLTLKVEMYPNTSVADPGCLSRIPDPTFSIPAPGPGLISSRLRICIKEFKYFNPKN